ncbi:uncharacterized protein LOC108102023 [Drosophila ficusphila]|uniref:uncharacterized protein LOC108102023 n=1 Tax=Drosophila ficusphila TaxID=30025 RepID=UPI0007E6962F|nr:uncharacterized protein LOC108102023 [Drosophila ficusphila]
MELSPTCWPIKDKKFIFYCRGTPERPIQGRLQTREHHHHDHHHHNHNTNNSFTFFHVEDDLRAFFITIGRSRLHHLDWFVVDKCGNFIRNGKSIYEYKTDFSCVYKRIKFLEGLLEECSDAKNASHPEFMVLHFPRAKAPTFTESVADSNIYFNWLICFAGLLLLFFLLK